MTQIVPNPDQFQQLATSPDPGPVVMLNLLKFKARAEGEPGSGADAYGRYGDAVVKMIEQQGGKVLWAGRGEQVLHAHRERGLERALVVACAPMGGGQPPAADAS